MAQKQTSGTHFPPGEALPVGYPLRGVQEKRGGGGGVKVPGGWGMVVMGLDAMNRGGLQTQGVDFKWKTPNPFVFMTGCLKNHVVK